MRNSEAFEIAKTLKPGDIIEYRSIMRRPASDRVETAKIKSVEVTASGSIGITYVPCDRVDSVQCGFGCHFIAEDGEQGRSQWGWQGIRILDPVPSGGRLVNTIDGWQWECGDGSI